EPPRGRTARDRRARRGRGGPGRGAARRGARGRRARPRGARRPPGPPRGGVRPRRRAPRARRRRPRRRARDAPRRARGAARRGPRAARRRAPDGRARGRGRPRGRARRGVDRARRVALRAAAPFVARRHDLATARRRHRPDPHLPTPKDVMTVAPARRPNILLVVTDDHAAHAVGAYGSIVNTTPRIDEIAETGARLDACYCTNSLCTPSRAAILTGTHSHVNGVTTLETPMDPSLPTFVSRLREHGYRTAIIGKWHLGDDDAHAPAGFDHR